MSKLRYCVPQKTFVSLYFSLCYSFVLYGSLAWQCTSKTNFNIVFILQAKCLRIITFCFYTDHNNLLLKELSYLNFLIFWNQRSWNFSISFFRNKLPKSICSQFNLFHEVHTRDARKNSLIYISRMSTSQCDNHSLRGDGASLWNKFFRDFFKTMIWRPSLDWSYFLWNDSYKLTKANYKLLTHFWSDCKQRWVMKMRYSSRFEDTLTRELPLL